MRAQGIKRAGRWTRWQPYAPGCPFCTNWGGRPSASMAMCTISSPAMRRVTVRRYGNSSARENDLVFRQRACPMLSVSLEDAAWKRTGVLTANDVTLDLLAGDWRIFRLRTGHRFSADDLLTAWAAVLATRQALARVNTYVRLLVLGSGLGSVGLLVLWKLPTTGHLTMVEVQAVSHALACRTVAYNDLTGRVTLYHQ